MKKRITAALLCLLMTLAVMPLRSSAENAQGGEAAVKTETVSMTAEQIQTAKNTNIGIGINLLYHCEFKKNGTKATYTYEDVWVNGQKLTEPSYLKYPNEPARLSHPAVRVKKQTDGSWAIDHRAINYNYYATRIGTASEFVSDAFFTSPDTVKAADGTIGIHDPTGEKVKAVLSLEEEDYQAIVDAFINWTKSTYQYEPNGAVHSFTLPTGYWDGSQGDSSTAVSADDTWLTLEPDADGHYTGYKAVPYVLKYQTDNVWFIDMIIMPRERYTLGYDRNLPDGYVLTGQKFPETTTHDPGDIASVVGNPNVQPSKGEEKLQFLYWVDDEGNRYGDGYADVITMVEDKILYAMWEVTTGSLRVTKEVINPDGGSASPDGVQFNFDITLSHSSAEINKSTFSYRIYNELDELQSSGQISNGILNDFELQDGWYIQVDGLPKDTACRIMEDALESYEAADMHKVGGSDPYWYRDVVIEAGSKTPTVVENVYKPPVGYTVEHYFEESDGSYPASPNKTEIKSASTAGELTEANSMIKTDSAYYRLDSAFHPDGVITQQEVSADGSTVVRIYYERIRSPHVVRYLDQDTGQPLREDQLRPGDVIGLTVTETAPEIPGYHCAIPEKSCIIQAETEDPSDQDDDYAVSDIVHNIITFYYTQNRLTISRSNTAEPVVDVDKSQVFVYEVRNTETNEIITVTIVGNGSTTIHGIPYGTYTVTQVGDWSWRYADEPVTARINADNGGRAETLFNRDVADSQWLDGNSPQIDNRKKEVSG